MKINKIENEKVFKFENVDMRPAKTQDYVTAEQVTGKRQGFDFMLALMAQICTFDGEKKVIEDLKEMEQDDFLELSAAMVGKSVQELLQEAQD